MVIGRHDKCSLLQLAEILCIISQSYQCCGGYTFI